MDLDTGRLNQYSAAELPTVETETNFHPSAPSSWSFETNVVILGDAGDPGRRSPSSAHSQRATAVFALAYTSITLYCHFCISSISQL
jgi:hypothetical protein